MLAMPWPRRTFLQSAGACLGVGWASSDRIAEAATPLPPRQFALGLVTYNLAAQWDLPTLLSIARTTGVAALELRTTHAHGVEPSLDASGRREVRQRFADSGVKLWGLGTVCEFHAADPKIVANNIETCKQFLDLGAELGGTGVKVRPNGFVRGVAPADTLKQISAALAACGEYAQTLQQEVWLEVHGAGTADPKNIQQIMEHALPSCVGVTWNSNATDLVDGSIQDGFARLQSRIKSCHINELYGRYPYRELLHALRNIAYDRYTLIEIPQKLPPEAGELLLRYYKALWLELADRV